MPGPVGFRKTSLIDYPGKVAAALFFPGCNLRCPWCHNRELALGIDRGGGAEAQTGGEGYVDLEEALAHIRRRRAVLGGVALSGGEPLLRPDLPSIVARIKEEGLPVKLDTNGTLPDRLEALLSDPIRKPDYIALDLKLAPSRYGELGGPADPGLPEKLARSAALVAASGIAHEYRSLALPGGAFTAADVAALAPLADSSPWYFSAFRPGNCLDERWNAFAESSCDDAARLAAEARKLGKKGRTR